MNRTIVSKIILGLLLWATTSFAADRAAIETHYLSYHKAGKTVVEMGLLKKVDAVEVEKNVEVMLADAVWMAGEYAKAFPNGQKLLKAVTDNVEAMKKLSFKELEHEWHDLHHFDKITDLGLDLKAEENEHFTDPIHSIVHPMLVLKAAQRYASAKSDEDLKAIKEEMEEGLEQMEKQKNTLLKR